MPLKNKFAELLTLETFGGRVFTISREVSFDEVTIVNYMTNIDFIEPDDFDGYLKKAMQIEDKGNYRVAVLYSYGKKNSGRYEVDRFTFLIIEKGFAYKVTHGIAIALHAWLVYADTGNEVETPLQPGPQKLHEVVVAAFKNAGYDCAMPPNT